MTIILGFAVAMGCLLGGFMALGGKVSVLWQPWEFVIIGGSAIGIYFMANTMKIIKDTAAALMEALKEATPKSRDYLDILGLLHAMTRELRTKPKSEIEAHVDNPEESAIFQNFPRILAKKDLTSFICDYCRLIIMGDAKSHEIEALMDVEIETISKDKMKAQHALQSMADGLPALGIVAAVLGVIKAMGALDQSPELLGKLIGAALVGTFAGIFMSYGMVGPVANKVQVIRGKQIKQYVIVKQTLIAYMNGAMPQVAVEHGRKTISAYERPSITDVEEETLNAGGGEQQAA